MVWHTPCWVIEVCSKELLWVTHDSYHELSIQYFLHSWFISWTKSSNISFTSWFISWTNHPIFPSLHDSYHELIIQYFFHSWFISWTNHPMFPSIYPSSYPPMSFVEFTKICINDMMKPWHTLLNKTPNKRRREGTKREY